MTNSESRAKPFLVAVLVVLVATSIAHCHLSVGVIQMIMLACAVVLGLMCFASESYGPAMRRYKYDSASMSHRRQAVRRPAFVATRSPPTLTPTQLDPEVAVATDALLSLRPMPHVTSRARHTQGYGSFINLVLRPLMQVAGYPDGPARCFEAWTVDICQTILDDRELYSQHAELIIRAMHVKLVMQRRSQQRLARIKPQATAVDEDKVLRFADNLSTCMDALRVTSLAPPSLRPRTRANKAKQGFATMSQQSPALRVPMDTAARAHMDARPQELLAPKATRSQMRRELSSLTPLVTTSAGITSRRERHNLRTNAALCAAPRPLAERADQTKGARPTVAWVDSMAPYGVTSCKDAIVRVTDPSPNMQLDMVSGSVQVESIVTVGMWLRTTRGSFKYIEIPDYQYVPTAEVELYPTQTAYEALGIRHDIDNGTLTFYDGDVVRFHRLHDPNSGARRGYPLRVWYGSKAPANPALATVPAATVPPTPPRLSPTWYHGPNALSRVVERTAALVAVKETPTQCFWRRMGFPGLDTWKNIHNQVEGAPFKEATTEPHIMPTSAVAIGRMKAKPFHKPEPAQERWRPLERLYMDFAGPTVRSVIHGFKHYCGVICACTGYARVFPCHAESAEVAKASLRAYLVDARAKLRESHRNPLDYPTSIIRCDQGAAFMEHNFVEFVEDEVAAKHSPACTYTPQQNVFIERLWSTLFGTARVLLASANLPPAFHTFALQTACFLHNRLPRPSRDGLSPYFMLTGCKSDVTYVRAFGAQTDVYLSPDQRDTTVAGGKLADRSIRGINVGPSEVSPGYCVYIPKERRVITSRHVMVDESVFPGLPTHRQYAWFDGGWYESQMKNKAQARIGDAAHKENMQPSTTASQTNVQPLATERERHGAPSLPSAPAQDVPPPTPARDAGLEQAAPHQLNQLNMDPSSIHYRRRHPVRAGRTGPYACYTDPTSATPRQAASNFVLLSLLSSPAYPAYVYTAAAGYAAVVRPTAEFGDVAVPTSYKQAMQSPHKTYWMEAINKELKGLAEQNVWTVMIKQDLPSNAALMNCHLIFDVKRKADGSIEKWKARLVADGNTQIAGVNFQQVFSTVVKLVTVRILLLLACANDYNLSSVDVRQAYLNAPVQEDLYMRVPPGLPRYDAQGRELVLKLNKSLYGLRQAAKNWNKLLVAFMIDWGFKQSTIDTCLFLYSGNDGIIHVVIWVDDLIISDSCPQLRTRFVTALAARFAIDDKGELHWVLGIKVVRSRTARTLALSQELYVQDLLSKLAPHVATTCKTYDVPMAAGPQPDRDQCPPPDSPAARDMADKHETYMTAIGALLWLSSFTRPDLTYAVSVLARYVSNPGKAHYVALQRVLAYLSHTVADVLVYKPDRSQPLCVYSDADWSSSFSTSGSVTMWFGCAIAWYTRLQRSISHSSAESEYVAASMAAREATFVRDVLHDFGVLPVGPTALRLDSKSAIDMTYDAVAFKKTKHVLRDANYLRDLVARQVFAPEHVPSASQLADIFTKALGRPLFPAMRALLLGEAM